MHDAIAEEFKQVLDIEITERVLQDGQLITRVYNPRIGQELRFFEEILQNRYEIHAKF